MVIFDCKYFYFLALRQVHSLFQIQFYTERDLVQFPVSSRFLKVIPKAAYAFVLVFLTILSSLSRNTNKMQLCNRIYYSKVYLRPNMFRAAHRSSSEALNCICSLWFIYPCGDQPLSTEPWQRPVYKPEAANTV